MATSLAEQLKKLRTPQTSLLLQDKKRPSLLFDPKEAANLDREIVLNIGQSGLQDLIKLCSDFAEFEESLFAQSALSLERSVQDSKINKRLDAGIEKFLILLSPYFLLNTAHKALEWLIHRFHIHRFNRDEFLMLILPYHETRIFVRALQLLDLSSAGDKWNWLEPLQKPGVPLSSLNLVNRVATDNALLKLLCNHVVKATTICADRANSLSTLYAFYTMSIVGAIDRSSVITEIQTNFILASLAKGLSSNIADFAASSYMIVAKLCTKARLDRSTLDYLMSKSVKRVQLPYEAVLLICFLHENSCNRPSSVSERVVGRIGKLSWFSDQMARVKASGVNVTKFIVPFLETSLAMILKKSHEESVEIRDTMQEILSNIVFEDHEIDAILKSALTQKNLRKVASEEIASFLAHLYAILETRYPLVFDEYLKKLMKTSESDPRSKGTLQFLMCWHAGARNTKDSLTILDRLNHPSPVQRISALEAIARGEVDVTENFRSMVNQALIARFNDDNQKVVKTLLNFPSERLKSLLPNDTLVDELMILLAQCNNRRRTGLALPAIKLVLEICEDSDDTGVFIASLPYLFPTSNHQLEIAMLILQSKFSEKNAYMQQVRKDMGDCLDAQGVSSAAFHNILKWELLPPTENILGTIKVQSCRGDATSMFFNLILLGSVCRVPVGALPNRVALEVIEIAADMTKHYPRVKRLEHCNQLNREKIPEALELTAEGILPLQACTYVMEMVHRRIDIKADSKLDFENDGERTRLLVRLLEIFLEGMNREDRREHYSWCLKIFFQRHFSTSRDMLTFFSQFFGKPVKAQTSLNCLMISLDVINASSTFNWIFQDRIFATNLFVSLARENPLCRNAAVEILKKLSHSFNLSKEGFSSLFQELAVKSTELSMDPDQLSFVLYNLLSPDPDVEHHLKRDVRAALHESRRLLLDAVLDRTRPIHTTAQLLDLLTHVNGPGILRELADLGLEIQRKLHENSEGKVFGGQALRNILQRFNSTTVEALSDGNVAELFDSGMSDHRLGIPVDGSVLTPSAILIRQIDHVFFETAGKISPNLQRKILAKLVDVVTDCEVGSVVAACNRAVQRIRIDARMVVEELKAMRDARLEQAPDSSGKSLRNKRRSQIQVQSLEIIATRTWKRGITLLEFVQRANNIENEDHLLPMLFELLRVCLNFEQQNPVEYVNQLLLSTIYHLVSKSRPIKDAHLHIDLISQCIRLSHNPQTHHHALLVLVQLFKVANVETALHNIMPIFTFMGSSVLRQDDAYSIQIISKTIETVVPIVNSSNDEKHATEILRIFVVSLPHIPEHRRIPVFLKLLQLLENHLHLFYLLCFESHVLGSSKASKDAQGQKNSSERLEFAMTISQEFSPRTLIDVCVKLVDFVGELPTEIDEDERKRKTIEFSGKHIFDVANNSPKQLRHFRYTALLFLSGLLSSPDLVNRVALLDARKIAEIETLYDLLVVRLIVLIAAATKSADLHQRTPKGKYWRCLLHNLYDILDAVNNLLPNNIFLSTTKRLMGHDLLSVRKKALDLLNARLQQKKFHDEDSDVLLSLIEPLMEIVSIKGKIISPELEIIQQTALITFKLVAKLLATENPAPFKPILDLTTELITTKEGPVLASAVLCVAELCASMRTHAIQSLNKFVPAIIRLMRTHCNRESPDVVVVSVVSALQKIVESVGNFLSLYLDQLLLELTRLSSLYTDTENPKVGLIVSRLKATTQKLASCIPMRVLLPAVSKTYELLLASNSHKCVPPLMSILAESFAHVSNNDLQATIPDLATFFLNVLQFRENVAVTGELDTMEVENCPTATSDDIVSVEESASSALVALVLKLSEATFRPLYYKLYDWAARYPEHRQRNITFYRLSANIAERLKSLFVLFAGHFVKHAASLLSANNSAVTEEPNELTLPDEKNGIELVEAILLTLHRVFTYDAHSFVNQERFESLAQPIVDQLENTIGGDEAFEKRARELVVPCVATFASATQDDSLHKQLVYQILLKTRHSKPNVRNSALSAIIEIARKLGQDFMPLLPETVPFLAELLEDEDETTEKNAQNAVRTLEEILGEPLQKYF